LKRLENGRDAGSKYAGESKRQGNGIDRRMEKTGTFIQETREWKRRENLKDSRMKATVERPENGIGERMK